MKRLQYLIFLFAAIVLIACTSVQQNSKEVRPPLERISQKGYSLLPLNESGWIVARRNASHLVIVKRGQHPGETFAIQAIPFRTPAFETHDEFVRLVQERIGNDADPQRHKITKREIVSHPLNGASCVKAHVLSEDRAAVKAPGKRGEMLLEMLSLTCAHPRDKNFGIGIIYSHRYDPGQGDKNFVEKGSRVLNSVQFTDL